MWPFKSKYDKLTREDVVDAICKLEKESTTIEEEIVAKQKQVDALKVKGKNEKSREIKLLYAKKINALSAEREQLAQRDMYLLYNLRLLNKLKQSIDDNQFFAKTSKMSLGNLLGDQKGLAKFLNKTLDTRVAAENVLTDADETFQQVEEMYEKNESIYGVNTNDDELLAVFEAEEDMLQFEADSDVADENVSVNKTDEE